MLDEFPLLTLCLYTTTITVIIWTIKLSILQGVLTGISYNGMRPLDMAHQKSHHTMVRGVLTPLTSIPYDYKVTDLTVKTHFRFYLQKCLKARNPELFVDSGLESTSRLFSLDGSGKVKYLIKSGTCCKLCASSGSLFHLFVCILCSGSENF